MKVALSIGVIAGIAFGGFCIYKFVQLPTHVIGLETGTFAQLLGAIATFIAVLVALFKEGFVRILRSPKLRARIGSDNPWTIKMWHTYYFLRIEIENTGKSEARCVQVYARRLEHADNNGNFVEVKRFTPVNMRWTHFEPGAAAAFLPMIAPNTSALCDLVQLVKLDDPATGPASTRADLQLALRTGAEQLDPGTYRLTLVIAAANASPVTKMYVFTHGVWSDEDEVMRSKNIYLDLQ